LQNILNNNLSIKSYQQALLAGETTVVKTVEGFLSQISQKNNQLNAFLDVYPTEALEQALAQDDLLQAGQLNLTEKPLTGVVIGIKDLLNYKDHHTAGGSKILANYKALFTATAVQRLIDAGAIIIGRQNCDEFGMGSTNQNSAFGPALNAADSQKVPGGSSGGSAVAVQAGMCHASIGTDTGGSVRQPAGYCNVVGFKPTYSRVSRWGLKAYASSFDTVGPIARSVEDAALLTQIMAGYDPNDATSSSSLVENYCDFKKQKYKIAYFTDAVTANGLQPEVLLDFEKKLKLIEDQGHAVQGVPFPLMKYFLPTYYILTTAEASSNLNRYDGVRYGYRSANAIDLMSMYKKTRTEGFGAEVKKRIMLGTFVLSANYYDAYYTKAQRVRRLIKEATDQLFLTYDFLVFPVAPTTAPQIGQVSNNPIAEYLADLYTVQANVVGNPAIAIPSGFDQQNMPIGFQIMGKSFAEAALFNFAKMLE
jgi:aspartyl-tRNA(Asn)/glutamyl-tRNA(Gln) amidotransferase subunit A